MSLQAFSVCYKAPNGNDANQCSYIANFYVLEICDLRMETEHKNRPVNLSIQKEVSNWFC